MYRIVLNYSPVPSEAINALMQQFKPKKSAPRQSKATTLNNNEKKDANKKSSLNNNKNALSIWLNAIEKKKNAKRKYNNE